MRFGVRTRTRYVCGLSLVQAGRLVRRCQAHGIYVVAVNPQ